MSETKLTFHVPYIATSSLATGLFVSAALGVVRRTISKPIQASSAS